MWNIISNSTMWVENSTLKIPSSLEIETHHVRIFPGHTQNTKNQGKLLALVYGYTPDKHGRGIEIF